MKSCTKNAVVVFILAAGNVASVQGMNHQETMRTYLGDTKKAVPVELRWAVYQAWHEMHNCSKPYPQSEDAITNMLIFDSSKDELSWCKELGKWNGSTIGSFLKQASQPDQDTNEKKQS